MRSWSGWRISADRSHILEFEWNDYDQLESLFKRYHGKIAAIILTPYHHPSFAPSLLPASSFWNNVEDVCRKNGTALVLDDVRCGWRLNDSGSHKYFNFNPDLAIYSKALGNGYAISACVGNNQFRAGASDVFLLEVAGMMLMQCRLLLHAWNFQRKKRPIQLCKRKIVL